MANFPFDPAPFLPPDHQLVQVEGRPVRVRVIAQPAQSTHEEWAIATIVPMLNLQAPFANVREILTEFLRDVRRVGFSEISKCPSGQAYVRLDSVYDRESLVRDSPIPFGDVHVIFQKHNQGLN